jgi:4-carboxymuconolactone decarboxylase
MASQEEKQAYINEMVQQRGYVLDYHKIAVQQDFEFTKRTNELIEEAYLKPRRLDRKTKELGRVVN